LKNENESVLSLSKDYFCLIKWAAIPRYPLHLILHKKYPSLLFLYKPPYQPSLKLRHNIIIHKEKICRMKH